MLTIKTKLLLIMNIFDIYLIIVLDYTQKMQFENVYSSAHFLKNCPYIEIYMKPLKIIFFWRYSLCFNRFLKYFNTKTKSNHDYAQVGSPERNKSVQSSATSHWTPHNAMRYPQCNSLCLRLRRPLNQLICR